MLPLVVTAGRLLADLATPLNPEEYRQLRSHEILLPLLSPATRAYYLANGRVLACLLRPGMTGQEVGRCWVSRQAAGPGMGSGGRTATPSWACPFATA
jgi:hypothetical protein